MVDITNRAITIKKVHPIRTIRSPKRIGKRYRNLKELQQISNHDHRNDGKKLAAFVVAGFGGVILSSMAIASAADAGEKLVKRMLSK